MTPLFHHKKKVKRMFITPSKANTYASEALRHSPDNHASPSDRYTIVNFRRRGQPYDQAKPFWISDEN
ncbi:hypothetical protein RhiirB3_453963 [Rhizophagus irregularis]|nr:hypothetical protein RhiirB3_453963 [Rhizophagus irregularis]